MFGALLVLKGLCNIFAFEKEGVCRSIVALAYVNICVVGIRGMIKISNASAFPQPYVLPTAMAVCAKIFQVCVSLGFTTECDKRIPIFEY